MKCMDFLLNWHTSFDLLMEKGLKYCLVYWPIWPIGTHWMNHIWLESLGFWTDWNISQSSKMHATHSYVSDWQICKNKQDFFAIGYCCVHIVIQMHFVLLTTISSLFVREGHFWIILKKDWGLEPPKPDFCQTLSLHHLNQDYNNLI